MKITIASGKGGTGKTTVAVNLAWVLDSLDVPVELLDCDVEEPNGHIFLAPTIASWETVGIPIPVVDDAACTGCRKCAEACRFNAIAVPKKVLVFPELCHGCGGCALACPRGAIREESRPIGKVEVGTARASRIRFVQGRLDVGQAMSPPLIRAVKKKASRGAVSIMDAPPGTSCPVVATVRDADYVVLVTEPTPFGLNDLRLAVETVRGLSAPFGVVINRADAGDSGVREYCDREGIRVLAEFPDDRRAAEAYARGRLLAEELPHFAAGFRRLWERIQEEVGTTSGSRRSKAS